MTQLYSGPPTTETPTVAFATCGDDGKSLLEQLLQNTKKLLKCYKATKDETLLEIAESLLQLAIDEAETKKQVSEIHLTPGVDKLPIPIVKPWVQPSDPLGPPVMVYGVPTSVSAYAVPPIDEGRGTTTADEKIFITTDTTEGITPFYEDSTND